MAAGDGLIVMTPTSINVTGTSGSINADGGVDFTAVTSLSLNGVFTSSYDNYLIVIRSVGTASISVDFRLRTAGTDASGSNYTSQYVLGNSTTVSGARTSNGTSALIYGTYTNQRDGATIHVYGPALAQPTALRSSWAASFGEAYLVDVAATHSLSTSYDGITFIPSTGNMTGAVTVFGYEE